MADVAATLAGWSSTTGSNAPSGGTTIGTGLDDNLREIQGVIVRGLSHKGADIASATTTDFGAVEGLAHDITGTTTITGFGTVRAGIWKIIKFEGALTLTHNATSLILPGGANITTADGDTAIVISEGSGNWRCVAYVKANGKAIVAPAVGDITGLGTGVATALAVNVGSAGAPVVNGGALGTPSSGTLSNCDAASDTAKGVIEIAIQSEMETGSSTTLAVTPGRQQYHPSAAKAWILYNTNTSTTVTASYNINSLTDQGTGQTTITIETDFSSANYCLSGMPFSDGTSSNVIVLENGTRTAGAVNVETRVASTAALIDRPAVHVSMFGDQ